MKRTYQLMIDRGAQLSNKIKIFYFKIMDSIIHALNLMHGTN